MTIPFLFPLALCFLVKSINCLIIFFIFSPSIFILIFLYWPQNFPLNIQDIWCLTHMFSATPGLKETLPVTPSNCISSFPYASWVSSQSYSEHMFYFQEYFRTLFHSEWEISVSKALTLPSWIMDLRAWCTFLLKLHGSGS